MKQQQAKQQENQKDMKQTIKLEEDKKSNSQQRKEAK